MTWIMDKIKEILGMRYLTSMIRTALAALAGYLLAIGIPPEHVEGLTKALDPIVAGIVSYLLAQLWSFLDKAKTTPKK